MTALAPASASPATSSAMRVVFWHDYMMFHQAPYIRALAELPDVTVHWAVTELLPEIFRQRGYPIPDPGKIRMTVNPTDEEMAALLDLGDDTVHVFFGLRNQPLASRAFEMSKSRRVRRLLMSENRFEPDRRLPLRLALYMSDALRQRRWIDALLCIGYTGRYGGLRFFSWCGYPARKIFPFLHLVERVDDHRRENAPTGPAPFEILFVGQLIRRKGLDILFRSLKQLGHLDWRLTIVGDGELRDSLVRQASEEDFGSRIRFAGTMDNAEIRQQMFGSQVLVLPSRFDGWGAVVSEALLCGLPVVCSERCGASDLVSGSRRGYVFRSGDSKDLAAGLEYALTSDKILGREAIEEWSHRISGPSAAHYFAEVVRHLAAGGKTPRPACPWMNWPRKEVTS